MRTARRFVNDESGATMALAIIMVVVLGVMGAGLVAFATKDLDTVVEENRGQAAFGVADAGIEAAKRQLKSDCLGGNTCSAHYDGGDDDLQWSATKGGLLLKDLDGDGNGAGGTPDNVNVQIRAIVSKNFRAISTGTLGATTRKVKANFEGSAGGGGGGGGGNVTFPGGWTPSSILINGPNVSLNASSFFSGKNIIFAGLTNRSELTDPTSCTPLSGGRKHCPNPWDGLKNEYKDNTNGGLFKVHGTPDNNGLKDWYSPDLSIGGTWNVVGRYDLNNQDQLTNQPLQKDRICRRRLGMWNRNQYPCS